MAEDGNKVVNHDLTTLVTPVKADRLEFWLKKSNYNKTETMFLVDGFRNRFDMCYQGPTQRQSRARNIPFTVGNKHMLWEKVLGEVKEGRYAGPFESPPFENYIQSPIGLVPKKGNKTRLIFHLSYDFGPGEPSVNACTPKELCSVSYCDLDTAVKQCLAVNKLGIK